MAEVQLDVQLESLLQVQQVSVVKAVDLQGLAGLLRQLLGAQKDTQDKLRQQQDDIDALKAAQPPAAAADQDGAEAPDDHLGGLQVPWGQLAAVPAHIW
jgi:hypothetical protein